MSWIDNLPWRRQKNNSRYAAMLNGYTPIFTQFGNDIFASDVVQQALMCIVTEMKKLNPVHVTNADLDAQPVNSDIQRILNHPNELMTKGELIEKIMWSLLLNNNAFVVPVYYTWKDKKTGHTKRKYTALYPIQPVQVDFIEDLSETLYIKFRFSNNYETTLPYSDVIHIRHKYAVNEYMGGNEFGQNDNSALLKTLELNNTLLEGVSNAMKSSFAINGVVKYNTMLDDGKTEANLHKLESKLKKSESGFLPLDLKADFIPIKKDIQLVDSDTLKFIDEKILRNWGVPLSILTGDFDKSQYESFYQKTLEGYVIDLSQAFTKTLFTEREKAHGNEIKFYPKDLIFMSVDQTLQMVNVLSPTGALYENEKRVAFGLKPLPELEGKRFMSLNWVDIDIANEYQMGRVQSEEGDDNEERVRTEKL